MNSHMRCFCFGSGRLREDPPRGKSTIFRVDRGIFVRDILVIVIVIVVT
jgi:hypothetical protein